MFQANLPAGPSLVRIRFSNLTMLDSLPRKLQKKTILAEMIHNDYLALKFISIAIYYHI
jgi:hypothetical protein